MNNKRNISLDHLSLPFLCTVLTLTSEKVKNLSNSRGGLLLRRKEEVNFKFGILILENEPAPQ